MMGIKIKTKNRTLGLPTLILCGLLILSCVAAGVAQETQYKEIRNQFPPAALKVLDRKRNEMVRGGAIDRKVVQDYYVRHVIASMTRASEVSDPNAFPELRKRVVYDLALATSTVQLKRMIRDQIFNSSKKLLAAGDKYSPTTRYNLLLLIGALNDREAGQRGTPVAVPYKKATDELLRASQSKTDIIRVGGMVGLARHAKLQAAGNGNVDRRIISAFASVLKEQPSTGNSADALRWMQRLATEAFADIGKPGAAKLLGPVVADETLPLFLRCSAARALGRLDLKASTIDMATAKGLGQIAVVSLTQQLEELRDYAIRNPGGVTDNGGRMRDVGGPDDPDADEKREEDPFVMKFRRQLTHNLACVQQGVKSLNNGKGDNNVKNLLTSLQSELDLIIAALAKKNSRPDDLFKAIQPPAARLETTVGQL